MLNANLNKMKNHIISGLVALTISLGVFWLLPGFTGEKTVKIEHISSTPASQVVFTLNDKNEIVPLDFTTVSEKVMDAVVHIRSTQTSQYINRGQRQYRSLPDPFRNFFDQFGGGGFQFDTPKEQTPRARMGTGSGVIINEDGYIVTNNHVIAGADDIEVTLHDNRTYKARVIGTDPSTDLALIQVKEKDLPTLPLVNSDDVQVGEWVLAVGNPFNLESTVTAGIVSAKGRNIHILEDAYSIESFIQTDAAINPGNSGGALINTQGNLVGISTAIFSKSGGSNGIGFAIPSSLALKVMRNLIEHGRVIRGWLGVETQELTPQLAESFGLNNIRGLILAGVFPDGPASKAGLQAGDLILAFNDMSIISGLDSMRNIAEVKPGSVVKVNFLRNGESLTTDIIVGERPSS